MNTLSTIALTAAALLAVTTGTAKATPTATNFAWTSTFIDNNTTPNSANKIAFTGTFSNSSTTNQSKQYSTSLGTHSTTTYENASYLTICETNGSSGTGTEAISVTFNFTAPSSFNTAIGGSIAETYTETHHGYVDRQVGSLTWSNSDPATVSFTNGAKLLITLKNVSTWDTSEHNSCTGNCLTVDAKFTVIQDPTQAVPEPASTALLGVGIFGLGFIQRRRNGGKAAAR